MSNITDKVVVITGVSSGIGESTAKLLAQQGARVVLGARRSKRIDALVQEISATGGKAIGFATDVTKRVEVEALIKQAVDGFGRVDVLINNAGIMPIAPMEALKVDEWDRQIDVNIKGLLYGVAAALPHMQKQKSGHFINITSVFGIKVFAPGGTVYCATKAAGGALTEGLRMELHSQNIRCTMISPGAVRPPGQVVDHDVGLFVQFGEPLVYVPTLEMWASVRATPMQVALPWLLHRAPNILLIPGTPSVKHLRENLHAATLQLSPETLAKLDSIEDRK